MDRLDRRPLFGRIAAGGGFARAAAAMWLVRATASKAIKSQARDLGARLLTRRVLIPARPGFPPAHPGLGLEFRQGERVRDLLREGVDCALRVGENRTAA